MPNKSPKTRAKKRKTAPTLSDRVLKLLDEAEVPEVITDHIVNILELHEAGGICRYCGCTEDDACMTDEGPCHWIEPGLCSACEHAGDELAG